LTARASDRLLGTILMVVSALWCWGVVESIPAIEDGSRLGARGFPLGLGLLLGFLGLVVMASSFVSTTGNQPVAAEPATRRRIEIWAIAATIGLLAGYGVLLEDTGFIIATIIITAVAIGPALGIWRPRLIVGMSVGMALGIYLVFGKLLGVYLPYGKLVNLAF